MNTLTQFATYVRAALGTHLADEEGASMVEYGILVGLIAVAAIVTIGLLGTTIDGFFSSVNTSLSNNSPAA